MIGEYYLNFPGPTWWKYGIATDAGWFTLPLPPFTPQTAIAMIPGFFLPEEPMQYHSVSVTDSEINTLGQYLASSESVQAIVRRLAKIAWDEAVTDDQRECAKEGIEALLNLNSVLID